MSTNARRAINFLATMPTASLLSPRLSVRVLQDLIERGRAQGDNDHAALDEPFDLWCGEVRRAIARAFGTGSPEWEDYRHRESYFSEDVLYSETDSEKQACRRRLIEETCKLLEGFVRLLLLVAAEGAQPVTRANPAVQRKEGDMIFIGHGRSPAWKDLRDFLKERLHLPVDEINRVPIAGATTVERLQEMLDAARFAFLVMTAEDEGSEGKARARQNVVHEVGLFQGKLGFKKAIVLLEEGCEEFSNITGLSQIRFPKGNIAVKFEDIRRVLEREMLIPGTGAAF